MRTISIQSFKGGTGKTISAANFAFALNKYFKKRVLIVEADAQSNISAYFGIDKDRDIGIADIIVGNKIEPYSLIKKTRYDNLHIITAGLKMYTAEKYIEKNPEPYVLRRFLQQVGTEYDYCIIDNAPAFSMVSGITMTASTQILIPVCLDLFSIEGLSQLRRQITHVKRMNNGLRLRGIFINRWKNTNAKHQALDFLNQYLRGEVSVFHTKIRESEHVSNSTFMGRSFIDISGRYGVSRDFKALVGEYLHGPNWNQNRSK